MKFLICLVLFLASRSFSLDLLYNDVEVRHLLDENEVTFDDLLKSTEKYINKEITFKGFIGYSGFTDGYHFKIYGTLNDLITLHNNRRGLYISPGLKEKVFEFQGCYVSIAGTLKKKRKGVYHLTDITYLNRINYLYFSAEYIMKSKDISRKPKCLGIALIESMMGFELDMEKSKKKEDGKKEQP